MAKLGVNVDHVATLRQARLTDYPDPVMAARQALEEKVSCITVHLREDRRHINENDVRRIRALDGCRLNLEMAAVDEIIEIALDVKPDQVTLVPERREELTTEGGLDVAAKPAFYDELSRRFAEKDIPVSLFIDPETSQIEASASTSINAVEINSAAYSEAKSGWESEKRLRLLHEAVKTATGQGLVVHAGHGLHYDNVLPVAQIPDIDELNIGHSIVSRAVFMGFARAVRLMKYLVEKGTKMQARNIV